MFLKCLLNNPSLNSKDGKQAEAELYQAQDRLGKHAEFTYIKITFFQKK
jgi:hypothetical protein